MSIPENRCACREPDPDHLRRTQVRSRETCKGFHRIERSYGNFVRSFAVPNAFDTEKIAADVKNGVLSVTLPKKEAAKPRQVKVEVKA